MSDRPSRGAQSLVTLADVERAHGGLKRRGTELHGPCPLCGGHDRFRVLNGARALIVQCRRCNADFRDLLAAIGLWECIDPQTGSLALHRRTRGREKVYRWPKGARPKSLVYQARLEGTGPVVITEGEKAATAAAGILRDVDVLATVCGAASTPEASALADCRGRDVVLWPNADKPGAAHMQAVAGVLADVARSIQILDPRRLAGAPDPLTDGWDAADWEPPDAHDALELVENAAAAAVVNGLWISGAEFVEEATRPPDRELTPRAPGLLYRARPVVAHAARGQGKTTYAVWCACRATEVGPVLLLVDDDHASWAALLTRFGADLARVRVSTMRQLAPPGNLEQAADGCVAVIIDSWRRWLQRASAHGTRPGAANDEGVAGPVIDRLVDLAHARGPHGPAVLVLQNESKAKDDTTSRGSFAVEDAVDAVRRIERIAETKTTVVTTPHKHRLGMPEGPWRMQLTDNEFKYLGQQEDDY